MRMEELGNVWYFCPMPRPIETLRIKSCANTQSSTMTTAVVVVGCIDAHLAVTSAVVTQSSQMCRK